MRKLSAWSLLFGSIVALFGTVLFASGNAPPTKLLEQDDLTKPAVIAAWLKTNSATAKRNEAELFFKNALKDKNRGAWGPAVKGFGISALRYPAPGTLIEYADVSLRSARIARERKQPDIQSDRNSLAYIESIYLSALAADSVLNTLTPAEKQQARRNADCLGVFVTTGTIQPNCAPLQTYGLNK